MKSTLNLQRAGTYSRALLRVCPDRDHLAKVAQELTQCSSLWRSHDLLRKILTSPAVSMAHRKSLLAEWCQQEGWSPCTSALIQLLLRDRQLPLLKAIVASLKRSMNAMLRQMPARIYSAIPLSTAQREAIVHQVGARLGKEVLATWLVDPSLLAGIRVEGEGVVMDGSLQHQLQRLLAGIGGIALRGEDREDPCP